METEIRELVPPTASANAIALYYVELNTLLDDAECHGLQIEPFVKILIFYYGITEFYPTFAVEGAGEDCDMYSADQPLPDSEDIYYKLHEHLIANFGRYLNKDVFIGINAICPTRKKAIVETERLQRRAIEKRAFENQKQEHPFCANDSLFRAAKNLAAKRRAAKMAKRNARKSTSISTTSQDSTTGTVTGVSGASTTTSNGPPPEPDASTAAALLTTEGFQDMSSTPAMTESNITSAAFETSTLCSAGMRYGADRSLRMSSTHSNDSTPCLLRTPIPEIRGILLRRPALPRSIRWLREENGRRQSCERYSRSKTSILNSWLLERCGNEKMGWSVAYRTNIGCFANR